MILNYWEFWIIGVWIIEVLLYVVLITEFCKKNVSLVLLFVLYKMLKKINDKKWHNELTKITKINE